MNASMLVEDLLNTDLLSIDAIENYYSSVCPECGGVMKEQVSEANGQGWYCVDCDCEQEAAPEQEAQEIYEWWFVSEWLYEQLKAHGEPVINSKYGNLWGRGATGQALLLDAVMGEIAEELEILEGQRSDWSKPG